MVIFMLYNAIDDFTPLFSLQINFEVPINVCVSLIIVDDYFH